MNFNVSSKARLIGNLNQSARVSYGPALFEFSTPESITPAGETKVILTPKDSTTNDGEQITLEYQRRIVNGTHRVVDLSEQTLAALVESIENATRVEFEPNCWCLIERDAQHLLVIDDYVVSAEIVLEVLPDEKL